MRDMLNDICQAAYSEGIQAAAHEKAGRLKMRHVDIILRCKAWVWQLVLALAALFCGTIGLEMQTQKSGCMEIVTISHDGSFCALFDDMDGLRMALARLG